MKGHFLISSNEDLAEGNIYADKSAIILDWLLREGLSRESFSLREAVKKTKVSLGLVQLDLDTIQTLRALCGKVREMTYILDSWLALQSQQSDRVNAV